MLSVELRKGKLPRVDVDFFRDLETGSLTELGKELRIVTQQVGALTSSIKGLSKITYFAVIPLLVVIIAVVVISLTV